MGRVVGPSIIWFSRHNTYQLKFLCMSNVCSMFAYYKPLFRYPRCLQNVNLDFLNKLETWSNLQTKLKGVEAYRGACVCIGEGAVRGAWGGLFRIVAVRTSQILWEVCRLIWSFTVITRTSILNSGLKRPVKMWSCAFCLGLWVSHMARISSSVYT